MSERDPSPTGDRPDGAPEPSDDWREQTTPGIEPVREPAVSGAGSSAVGAGWAGPGAHGPGGHDTTPQYSTSPVRVRRPDALAALLLVLAGIAGLVTLFLPWLDASTDNGLDLVRRGFDEFDDFGRLIDTGFWQPLAVVLGGGALLVLGLLMFFPARSHRTLGVLALLVALLAAAAVVVVANGVDWSAGELDLGYWFAAAVAALGLLGALKAMLTAPRAI